MRDTIDMAREAGLPEAWISETGVLKWLDLKAFEALVRADEREQALAAPVQEPVAWMHTMIDDVVVGHRPADLNVHPDRWMPLYKDPSPCQTCQALARTVMMDQTAHDTTPPAAQRQWVGLTDEEIQTTWDSVMDGSVFTRKEVYKAIEAKLKEKNNG
jgi:hypothetical protein